MWWTSRTNRMCPGSSGTSFQCWASRLKENGGWVQSWNVAQRVVGNSLADKHVYKCGGQPRAHQNGWSQQSRNRSPPCVTLRSARHAAEDEWFSHRHGRGGGEEHALRTAPRALALRLAPYAWHCSQPHVPPCGQPRAQGSQINRPILSLVRR